MRVCDRCGAKIGKRKQVSSLEDWGEELLLKSILGEIDLCQKCTKEFIQTFLPEIRKLKEEAKRWFEQGKLTND